jgi:hypothetical protein
MGSILNTIARWLTGGLAIWSAGHLILIGLIVSHGAGAMGLIPIGLGFVFLFPGLLTLCGGGLTLIRWFWGVVAVLSLIALTQPLPQDGLIYLLVYALLGLVFALVAKDKKPDVEGESPA